VQRLQDGWLRREGRSLRVKLGVLVAACCMGGRPWSADAEWTMGWGWGMGDGGGRVGTYTRRTTLDPVLLQPSWPLKSPGETLAPVDLGFLSFWDGSRAKAPRYRQMTPVFPPTRILVPVFRVSNSLDRSATSWLRGPLLLPTPPSPAADLLHTRCKCSPPFKHPCPCRGISSLIQ
jgi:hypothetical protein